MSRENSFFSKFSTFFDLTLLPKIVWKNRLLLRQFVVRNILLRYRGSFLGVLWSLIQPLLMLCVYTFVFSVVLGARWGKGVCDNRGEFAINMFCGMAVYTIFAESVTQNVMSVAGNVNLVKKVIFPLEILPLAQVMSSLILSMLWFLMLLFGVIFVFPGKLNFTMLLLPLILLPVGCLSLGVSYFVASVGVYVRDTPHIVGVVLQIMFFMTPIFYTIETLPKQYRWPLKLNPLAFLIGDCREIFINGHLPNWGRLGVAAAVSLLVLHLGFFWFRKTKKGFADVL